METIYSITSDKGDKVYIGRTAQTLNSRKCGHHCDYRNNKYCSSRELFDDYGLENCVFTALEECAKEQGAERERYHIENTSNVVNIRTPGRTKKEWYEDHKEQLLEQQKAYDIINKEHRQAYMTAYAEKNRLKIKERKQASYRAKKKALQQIDVVLQ